MSTSHTVKQGEYLSMIALDYGFADYWKLWSHPENKMLREKRQNPNVLFPGDIVFIPENEGKVFARPTDQRHRFVLTSKKLMLRLVVEDAYEKPVASAMCELLVEGSVFPLTTDGQGRIEHEIPADAQKAQLIIRSPKTPLEDKAIPILIGDLDPVDEVSGQKARLNNLGYFPEPFDDMNEGLFLSAVEEFQCDHGLVIDGKCGRLTQTKLKQIHGC